MASIPRWARWALFAFVIGTETGLIINWQLSGSDRPPRGSARDSSLSLSGLELYAPPRGTVRARAILIFFGDTSCWRPYRRMASSLADDGYAVIAIGSRVMPRLAVTEDSTESRMATDALAAVITRGLQAIDGNDALSGGAPPTPVVLMGHARGATSAIWVANHVAIAGLRGVVTLAPPDAPQSGAVRQQIGARAEWFAEPGPSSSASHRHAHLPTVNVAVASIQGSLGPRALLMRPQLTDTTRVTFSVPFSTARLTSPFLTSLAVRRSLDWILVPN